MANEDINHEHGNPSVEFEHEDLSTKAIFGFMIGLAITGVVIYFIITGMYTYLDKYEREQASTASPLVSKQAIPGRHIPYAPGQDYVSKTFSDNGAPLLEVDEKGQLRDFLMKQAQQLNSYGWVDEKAGVAHIPIEQAMKLIVQRGLPVRPESGMPEKGAAASKKAPKQQM